MRRRLRDSSSSNGPPTQRIAKFGVILALFVFATCISLACTSEVDNDLVFDEDYQTNDHKSSSSSHESSENAHFFKKLVRPIRAVLWDWFSPSDKSTSSESSVTEETTKERTRRDNDETSDGLSSSESDHKSTSHIVKKSPSPEDPPASENRDRADVPADEEEEGEESDEIDSSGSSPSSVPGSDPTPENSEKTFYRLLVYVLEPYSEQLSSKSSPEFQKIATELSSAIDAVLGAPDFVKSSVVGITRTKNNAVSKVFVDIEISGTENEEKIEDNLRNSLLNNNDKLGSLSVVPDRLNLIPAPLLQKCRDDQLSCDAPTFCFLISDRCNGLTNCPDLSDEKDCPNIDEDSIKDFERLCRGDNQEPCPRGIRYICDTDKCNGKPDCYYGEDEDPVACNRNCPNDEFKCGGECIPLSDPRRCNGTPECSNHGDEENCEETSPSTISTTTTPSTTTPSTTTPSTTTPSTTTPTTITPSTTTPTTITPSTTTASTVTPSTATPSTTTPRTTTPSTTTPSTTTPRTTTPSTTTPRTTTPSTTTPRTTTPSTTTPRTTTPSTTTPRTTTPSTTTPSTTTPRTTTPSTTTPSTTTPSTTTPSTTTPRTTTPRTTTPRTTTPPTTTPRTTTPRTTTPSTTTPSTTTPTTTTTHRTVSPTTSGFTTTTRGTMPPTTLRTTTTSRRTMPPTTMRSSTPPSTTASTTTPKPIPVAKECRPDQYKCYDERTCFNTSQRCDNVVDCPGGEDEAGCNTPPTCPPGDFVCGDGKCVPQSRVCDGTPDCEDYTDEAGAKCNPCSTDQFQCLNRQCIPLRFRCDGVPDCQDRSDESPIFNCNTTKCLPNEFMCRSGHRCVLSIRRCDGYRDCRDGSDEEYCDAPPSTASPPPPPPPVGYLNLKAYPVNQAIKESQEVVFLCRDEGILRAQVTWEKENGRSLPLGSRINVTEGRLEIPNIQLSDAGAYVCLALGSAANLPGSRIRVNLVVEPWPLVVTSRPACGIDQHTCHNGECISQSLTCNGRADCSDGSDEMRCPKKGAGCEPNEFQCANKRCIQKIWLCDAENDCGDFSDESNCKPTPPGSVCRSDEFKCFSSNPTQCIPKAFQCDYNSDCADGSDERGCSQVIIIKHPQRNVSLYEGELFTITCEALGTPTPEIVWRLNWGHVPAKCTSTTVEGDSGTGTSVGTLTCPRIAIEDAGAYSCEGINSRGSVFAIDTILVVTRYGPTPTPPPVSPCENGVFNSLAQSSRDCVRCFCFGITTVCRSANLFTYEIRPPANPRRLVNVQLDESRDRFEIRSGETSPLDNYILPLSSNSFVLSGANNQFRENIYPYIALPETYLGNQLKSYGGIFRYHIRFVGSGSPVRTPDIILSGNGRKLLHFSDSVFTTTGEKDVSVPLLEQRWFTEGESNRSDIPERQRASREDIMMTLVNLDQILIKTQYFTSAQIDTTISDISLDSAGTEVTGQQASLVEECTCPQGYSGLSCESCASDYVRQQSGAYLGTCVARPSKLEPIYCSVGYYRPLNGPCLPCPCAPYVQTCPIDRFGIPVCQCPEGYIGQRCESCAPGYFRSPTGCQRTLCNEAGSLSLIPNPVTGSCMCKQNTVGPYCDQCQSNTFYLSPSHVFGCIRCFCMGVTQNCASSHLYRNQIRAPFYRDYRIGARSDVESSPNSNIRTDSTGQESVFTSFIAGIPNAYYWSLPQPFLGNKVTSYGGFLNYTLRYVPAPGSEPMRNNAPDVELISEDNSIRLHYFHPGPVEPNVPQRISIPILEEYWHRADNQETNREHLLMTLADLKAILIKASHTTNTLEAGLQNVVLDVAEERYNGQNQALEVEECRCPPGYRGTSCEECDAGYYRVDEGLYLGTCVPCNCNGNSLDCDSRTGICVNCRNHTTGDHCEVCEPGYTGNPAARQPCTRYDNTCVCDPRGSLSSDCVNGQCTCKSNVEGSHCDSCKAGTFDLQADHTTGCLSCYCSGATTSCQSSNFFVTQIPMPLVFDENHGFTLTSANRERVIKTGFKVNIEYNQVTYDYTTERGQELFWSLPSNFVGNKVTSYGGNLTWSQRYDAPVDAVQSFGDDVVIYGDGISVHWTSNVAVLPNNNIVRSVKLVENDFRRVTKEGTQRASRWDMLRVLSKIESILIRASYASQTTLVFIGDVSMDTAVSQPLSSVRATHVENCRCPPGFRGMSCESCAPGFYQVSSSEGYKDCRKCPCNGREQSCSLDAFNRVVCKCQPGFTGQYCERKSGKSFYLLTGLKPLNVWEELNTMVNVTCVYESSDKLKFQFIRNYTDHSTVPVTEPDDNYPPVSENGVQKWKHEKVFHFKVDKALKSVICQVINENGNIFGTVYALINPETGNAASTLPPTPPPPQPPSPTILVNISEPYLHIVLAGNTVRLSCSASSQRRRPVRIVWSKENDVLPPQRALDDGNGYFVILNAVASDSGTYICTAFDQEYYVAKKVEVTVQDASAPKVIITPETPNGQLDYRIGDPIVINCEVTGVPVPIIDWIRDNGFPVTSTNVVPGRNELRIAQASRSDSGTYTCRARNSYGSDSKRINIFVQEFVSPAPGPAPEPIRLSFTPPEYRGNVGETIRIDCIIITPTDPSNYRLSWSRLGSSSLPPNAEARDGTLVIHRADESVSGQYVCRAISEQTNLPVAESAVPVIIEGGRDTREPQLPVISIDPVSQVVPQGQLAIIRCNSASDPTAPIFWRKANENMTDGVQIRGSELRIPVTQIRDRGVYVCEIQNAAGLARSSSTLEIERREPPEIVIYPQPSQMIVEGGSAIIQCQIRRGTPQPTIKWLRRGQKPLTQNVEELKGALRFRSITEEDAGEYICIASNDAGQVDAVATLEVISLPTISISPAGPVVEVLAGQPVQFECRASGKPAPTVEWQPSASRFDEPRPPGTAVLSFNAVQPIDANTYVCVASNVAGRTEERVQLVVSDRGPQLPPTPDSSISPDEAITFPQGANANLRCISGSREEIFTYWSREDNLPLKPTHDESQPGLLVLYNVDLSDSGKYVCTGVSKTTGRTLFTQSLTLRITAGPPEVTLYPPRQIVRPGDSPFINCSATGSQPISIYWSSVSGTALPRSASFDRGLLQFNGISVYDAGRYVCRAENNFGQASAVAEVLVSEVSGPRIPIIRASDRTRTALENSNMDLTCVVDSTTQEPYEIVWSRERGELPLESQSSGGTLRFYRLKQEDSGQYTCRVKSAYGSSEDHIWLQVERACLPNEFQCKDGPCIPQSQYCDTRQHCADNSDEIDCHKFRRGINNVTLSIIPRPSAVKVGESIELFCSVEGDDRNSVTWSKEGGYFDPNVQAYSNPLRISNIQLSNIGTYRCSAVTKDGIRSIDYDLRIELPPTVSTTTAVSEKRAPYGQNIDLYCITDLDPPVNYTWVVHSHEKSLRRIVPNTQNLTVTKLNANHSGLYFCNVDNGHAFVTIPQVLIVDNVIPAFNGSGYIALPPLTQAIEHFDIEINFKPNGYDGVLLFNSQSRDPKQDFVSLSLHGGYPVFKFNLGSKPAVIRGDIQLQPNKWHSIRLTRLRKNGTMEVDGIKFTGSASGNFETLDLQQPFFVGGHPNYSFTQQVADINIGFEGCINRLRIDSKEVNLREDAVDSAVLLDCHNCDRNPCFNGGFCQETSSSTGHMCVCPPGFSGESCEVRKTTCYLDSCGSGQCLENDYGIECLCPFGKAGKNCRENIKIHVPAFTKQSYMAYSPQILNEKMKLSLRVKPIGGNTVENGLVLFMAKGENGADFISLYTLNSYMQLKFRIRGQTVVLQSTRFLVPGEYVTVSLSIDASQVQFGVSNETTIAEEFNPTNEISDFKWLSKIYIGGYDKKSTVLPEDLPVKTGFYGCIASFEILGIDTSILTSYDEAVNINDCYTLFGDICEATTPCRNGGSCFTSRDDYRCDCPVGFSGRNCERHLDACELQRPCKNGGTCVSRGNSYKCSCPLGFGGAHCGSEVDLGYSVAFHADGYVEVPETTTVGYQSIGSLEIIFRTKYPNGLIFWRGLNDGGRSEYVAVAIRNGFVQLAFRTWGSFDQTISASNHRVDDNADHSVVIRHFRQPTGTIALTLDGQTTDSKALVEPLNARGNIFAGGLEASNYRLVADNLYTEGFEGCILTLRINNLTLSFDQAVSGVNVATCNPISSKSGGVTTSSSPQNSTTDQTRDSTTQQKDALVNKPSMLDPFSNVNSNISRIYSKTSKNYSPFRNGSSSRKFFGDRIFAVFLSSFSLLRMLIVSVK